MVTLIATSHKESGACKSDELYRIIEKISPDIIFEEIPPSQFDDIYEGKRQDFFRNFNNQKILKRAPYPSFPSGSRDRPYH